MEGTTAAAPGAPAGATLAELQSAIAAQTARLWSGVADVVEAARAEPWEWVPLTPGTTSPRSRDMAVRACALELAVSLREPETVVLAMARDAVAARRRLPQLWSAFLGGSIGQKHLRVALEASTALEDDACREFDTQLVGAARNLSAARLRPRARTLAERLCSAPLAERHRSAAETRRVWVEYADDAMAWLNAYLPASTARRAMARLHASADVLASASDEIRTHDQLRADVLSDLLTGDGTPHAVTATVALTVPVLSLLDTDSAPATLDGVVPIDPEAARRICADAPSFFRVLTDPIRSTVVDIDRRSYRPPADLARLIRQRDVTCTAPGCSRRAEDCDLDHTIPWSRGGSTSAENLSAVCPPHHRVKHETLWKVEGRDGRMRWTSPNGIRGDSDPPPF